ncbi:nitrogen regulation protein NR(I) [Aliikangiella sp. IMCC44359]|uniref:nitrogen regulation protein NR(I) n=1 Tax=Aliikangiella sp. IMCC44359 TaxID=3459125 RepID=UPI00403AA10E
MTQNTPKKLLLVDDDDSIRWVLNELLNDLGHHVTQAISAEEAIEQLSQQDFDLVISDVRMSGKTGMELLEKCKSECPKMPIIIMTAHSDLDSAVNAYQKGAYEYLPKPFDLDEVSTIINKALAPLDSQAGNHPKTQEQSKFSIIGESASMQDLYRAIGRLSNSHVTVLLHGESGTGKELVANALHQHSPRKNAPFIALNMAAIPKDLIESELFGHEKGSFTGASGRYLGRFEQADNGTLFLDEIGDMPLETQTRLLRVLSEGTFYRIGATQATRVDVRIIAATHQNLLNKVKRGEFREDLYHRLNVIPLHLPPLRERSDDIPILAEFFLKKISEELIEPQKQISPEALDIMQSYPWSGNVRQLENVCRWLSVMTNSQVVLPHDLPKELQTEEDRTITSDWQSRLNRKLNAELAKNNEQVFIEVQQEFEKIIIKSALANTSGKKAEASKLLGWGRNTLTRKLKEN